MVSIIIPTLFKCPLLYESLKNYQSSLTDDDELILIDNANSSHNYQSERIRHLKYSENNFVNKSWNIGAEIAKNDVIVIANDDIFFNYTCYKKNILPFLNSDTSVGLIGFDIRNLTLPSKKNCFNNDSDSLKFVLTSGRAKGFGMLMALKKYNYHQIPNELKIYCGDDYLFLKNKNNYISSGLHSVGYTSYSSKQFDSKLAQEKHSLQTYL